MAGPSSCNNDDVWTCAARQVSTKPACEVDPPQPSYLQLCNVRQCSGRAATCPSSNRRHARAEGTTKSALDILAQGWRSSCTAPLSSSQTCCELLQHDQAVFIEFSSKPCLPCPSPTLHSTRLGLTCHCGDGDSGIVVHHDLRCIPATYM